MNQNILKYHNPTLRGLIRKYISDYNPMKDFSFLFRLLKSCTNFQFDIDSFDIVDKSKHVFGVFNKSLNKKDLAYLYPMAQKLCLDDENALFYLIDEEFEVSFDRAWEFQSLTYERIRKISIDNFLNKILDNSNAYLELNDKVQDVKNEILL